MWDEDTAFAAWMSDQAGCAEAAEQARYEAWRDARVADGEDGSEEAYVDYLEGFLPVD